MPAALPATLPVLIIFKKFTYTLHDLKIVYKIG